MNAVEKYREERLSRGPDVDGLTADAAIAKLEARADALYERRMPCREAEIAQKRYEDAEAENERAWGERDHYLKKLQERNAQPQQAEAALAAMRAQRCEGCVSCDTCSVQNAAWVRFGALEADTGFACNCWTARAGEGKPPTQEELFHRIAEQMVAEVTVRAEEGSK